MTDETSSAATDHDPAPGQVGAVDANVAHQTALDPEQAADLGPADPNVAVCGDEGDPEQLAGAERDDSGVGAAAAALEPAPDAEQ